MARFNTKELKLNMQQFVKLLGSLMFRYGEILYKRPRAVSTIFKKVTVK